MVPGSGKDGRISLDDVEAYASARNAAPKIAPPAHVSPLARRVAEDKGIDLAKVNGSGTEGRILRKDVEHSAVSAQTAASTTPVKGVRAVIFERMAASAQQTAPVTLTTEIDATALVHFRAGLNAQLGPSSESRISFNAILIKLVAAALREFPYMNARLQDNALQLLADIHVGLAVDTDKGLVVPVVHDVLQKPLAQVNQEMRDLAERAVAGRSNPDDFAGGTFTITNLGAYGVDMFTPIINLPEIAILGIGRIVEKPVAHVGGIHLRQRMVLSLTFDHRLVDGAPAARFLQRVGQMIETVSLEAFS
jgi:pyruvate dehydrogenase E2 component (dihydrolipoamide acetyltransferase)